MPEKILIIEDEARMRRVLQLLLETSGYSVETAVDGEDGILKWKTFQPDIVFTDLKMPRADGMAVLRHRNLKYPDVPVIILTAFGTIPTAVEAIKQGASDYITKPVDNDIIIEKARAALKKRKTAASASDGSDPDNSNPDGSSLCGAGLDGSGQDLLIGSSAIMEEIRKELALVATTSTSVLITGESGTGKELAARTIHNLSDRRAKPFVRLNCAAIPAELMESELFGHTKGAFTGAESDRKGAFLKASSGTLFLDEIGDLPLGLQAKILHGVEDKVVTPVGSNDSRTVDVKIVSATNQDVEEMVARQTFRADLYFRLNAYTISMPALKKRPEDIPELTLHFLSLFSQRFGRPIPCIRENGMTELTNYAWPGNVRQLKNVVERLTLVSKGCDITKQMICELIHKSPSHASPQGPSNGTDLITKEKEMIEAALSDCGWNISKAARRLGITRNTLRYRIRKHDLK